MKITSTDFETGHRLADSHAYLTGNLAPQLAVSELPEGTAELALIVHDPDAPMPRGFTHWIRYGIPAADGEIAGDGVGRDVVTDFGEAGWGGPMPPVGHGVHHYYFWVYALSEPVVGDLGRDEFLTAYGDRILAQERLVGLYSRD